MTRDYFTDPKVRELAKAAAAGDLARVDALIAQGANINAQGKDGVTPLLFCMAYNRKGVQRLLEQGANPNLQTSQGDSPISYAAEARDPWYLKTVLSHGGNPNLVNPRTRETPIFRAVFGLSPQNVRLLIEAGANLNAQEKRGDTPAILAADLNQFDIVLTLFQAGADFKIADHLGYTVTLPILENPVNAKGEAERQKLIEFLKQHGVDIEEEKRKIAAIRERLIQAETQAHRQRLSEQRKTTGLPPPGER